MRIEQCSDARLFYDVLIEFEDCFPHLTEKISSLSEYAQKVVCFGRVLIAVKNGNVVGLCAFYDNNQDLKIGYITLIGVKEEYRNCHIGQTLLLACEEMMRQSGMQSVRLEVDNDNEVATHFYICMGYVKSEEVSDTSHYMIKQL